MKEMPKEKSLVVNHILYLTPEQRIALVRDRTPAQVVGISVPVWLCDGKSNEPAQEVFCQYTITNEQQEMMLSPLPTGYRINLPQPKPSLNDSEQGSPDLKKLGNPEDGGMGWLLFKQFQKIKHKDRDITVLHYVELRDWEYFWDSVTMKDRIEETVPSACSPNPQPEPLPDSTASPN
jgi:hypothetical protein